MQYVLIAFAVLLFIALTFFVISHFEKSRLTCPVYQVSDPRVPEAFAGKRIVFLSDLHSCTFGRKNQKLYEAMVML